MVNSEGHPVSWSQFGDWVGAKADELKRADLSKPIVYRSKNTVDDVVTAIAIACVGGTDAPLDNRLPSNEFDRRVELLKASSPGSKTILWTSGTTSQPMGVMQSHEAWLDNAAAKLKAVPQNVDDVRLTVLPLSHAYARTCDLGTWLISGCALAVDLGMKGLVRSVSAVNPTLMNVVPSMAYELLKRDVPGLDRLRLLGVGGAALSDEAFGAWKKRGVTVIQGYGLTETGPVIASATPENATAGLVGDFVDGWQHEIREGVLWVRGPSLMQGYWQDREATDDRIDAAGWLDTNDQVEVDPKTGQLRILGRSDDVIVLDNAVKIHPALLERAAQQIVGVRHAMLILRDQLELWIDGEPAAEEPLRNLLLQHPWHPWGHSTEVRFFDRPLTIEAGELTSKLTIRRAEIVDRLSS
ncbi:AMP-binding protein [Rubripirellula obstinata]|uniref:AMP-binding protein n=1 Tax=Rubripirellula obstinata TaxID=406547 RepID=UPI00122C96EF|nr:AMP-binding protein [Rubripirellula obstinata]